MDFKTAGNGNHPEGGLLMKPIDKGDDTRSLSDGDVSYSSSDSENFEERHSWGSKAEFILSAVGYCVGLGNLWRFPYVCMRNGGGAFLIPFVMSLMICALPVYFLEQAIGQFIGKSALHAWCICPMLKGIGVSMNILCILCTWYYSMILGWSLIYLIHSFKSPLPWTLCGQSWNSPSCMTPVGLNGHTNVTAASNFTLDILNATVSSGATVSDINSTLTLDLLGMGNATLFSNGTYTDNVTFSSNDTGTIRTSSSVEFWLHNVLEISQGLHDMGGLPWHTSLSVIVANIVVLLAVIKGVNTSGKVVYVTATLPYLLLFVIIIVGCTMPGAADGILFYIRPDFSKLFVLQTWLEAAIQVFYSLGCGWGGLVTMASYNKFHNNCMRDSILLTLACEGTSVFGGFAIFSVLGHMAKTADVPIESFNRSGPGLVFIVYPEAISYLPLPQLWGVLFFIMLFTLGLDTQFTFVETVLTTVADLWPVFVNKWRKTISTTTVAIFAVTGLVFAARGGVYLVQLVDWYIAAFTLMIQAALECLLVGWVYGADRFCGDIELMIGRRPYYIFVIAWKYICPFFLLLMWATILAFYKPPTYEGYTYPAIAEIFGWFIAILPFMGIVGWAFWEICRRRGTLMQRLKSACSPSPEWVPALKEARAIYKYDCGVTKSLVASQCERSDLADV